MRRLILPFTGIVSMSAMVYILYLIITFPNQINLVENMPHNLEFNSPFSAEIVPDTVTALKVNSKPVADNINVKLSDGLTIESDSGTVKMTLNAFGMPIKSVNVDVVPELEIIPCGLTVGVEINTAGVLVVATGTVKGYDGESYSPSEGKLLSGDLIVDVNGKSMTDKDIFIEEIRQSDNLQIKLMRDNEIVNIEITPVKSANESRLIGAWVRDATRGIGTVTYYNPSNNAFGALGHGILDVDTKQLISVRDGKIMEAKITDVKKGSKGSPGELVGELYESTSLGEVKLNTPFGIYGTMDLQGIGKLEKEKKAIALQDQVHEGPAKIYSDVDDEVIEYDVFIESLNRFSNDDTKGLVLRITDPTLLHKTNGIVQGMSGSPIIQNDKVIGAVTHVFVQDPTKGYGIFIENMLKQERKIAS